MKVPIEFALQAVRDDACLRNNGLVMEESFDWDNDEVVYDVLLHVRNNRVRERFSKQLFINTAKELLGEHIEIVRESSNET